MFRKTIYKILRKLRESAANERYIQRLYRLDKHLLDGEILTLYYRDGSLVVEKGGEVVNYCEDIFQFLLENKSIKDVVLR